MNIEAQVSRLISILRSSPGARDSFFDKRMEQLKRIMADYADNPLDMSLLRRVDQIAGEIEALEASDLSAVAAQKAKVVSAVVFSRIRRSHYSAYLAGKSSVSTSIGAKYKTWMNNAAANGALNLNSALEDALQHLSHGESIKILEAFAASAKEDARTFLSLASDHDPDSVLTAYNTAKIDILSRSPKLVENGCSALLAILPPNTNSHPADLRWHEDNYNSFTKSDMHLRDVLHVEHGSMLEEVDHALKRNREMALRIIDSRGDIWNVESASNRGAIIASTVGTALLGLLALSPESREALKSLLELVSSFFAQALDPANIELLAGDGGLPFRAYIDTDLARELMSITFSGDGGLPI